MANNVPASETVIGADAAFKGELSFDGSLRIDGKFEGKLNTKGNLTLSKGAALAGEVHVGGAMIDGTFKGNLSATDKVELNGTAQVQGDIRAPRLAVAEGATLIGNVAISPDILKGSVERDSILGSMMHREPSHMPVGMPQHPSVAPAQMSHTPPPPSPLRR
jgi:cytoskeletal protein CcmA (bactofilin family)